MTVPEDLKPKDRLRRMHQAFAEDLSILAEDYEHFTGISPLDEPISQSIDSRKLGELSEPLDLRRN
jgi:hypothetical protein